MSDWPEGVHQDDVNDIIAIVAGSLHRKYRQYVDLDDVRQTLAEWCWKKRDKLVEYLVRDYPHDRKRGQAALMKSLYREGSQMCRREKAARSGYEVSDEYFYSVALVEEVIQDMITGSSRRAEHVRHTPGDPAEGGNQHAIHADIRHGVEQLDEDTRTLVISLLGVGTPASELAEERAITPQAVRQRVQRACVRIVKELGGESPWR